MSRVRVRWFAAPFCGLSVALLTLAGCGAGSGDLSGTVTYKDMALRQGTVVIAAADGSSLSGTIQDDGSYSVKNIPQGLAKIGVSSPDPKTVVVAQRKDKGAPKTQATAGDNSTWVPIPPKYSDAPSSGLTFTIKSGDNKHNIELK